MKRIQLYLGLLTAFSLIFSCVPPDPAAVYGPNWNNPNPNNHSGGNITGPRILHKIELNSLLQEEYTSTAGVVSKTDFYTYSGSVQSAHNVINVTYNGNKISYFEFHGSDVGTNNTTTNKYYPTYDSAGKIISYTLERFIGSLHVLHVTGTVSYNSANQPNLVVEKMHDVNLQNPNSYTWTGHQYNTSITYSGNNVTKATLDQHLYDTSNNSLLSTQSQSYEYAQFDDKISPYSTLSKDYRLLFSLSHPALAVQLSYNNPLKIKITMPIMPAMEYTLSYQYDPQNYAVSTAGGTQQYIYKPL